MRSYSQILKKRIFLLILNIFFQLQTIKYSIKIQYRISKLLLNPVFSSSFSNFILSTFLYTNKRIEMQNKCIFFFVIIIKVFDLSLVGISLLHLAFLNRCWILIYRSLYFVVCILWLYECAPTCLFHIHIQK